MKQFFEGDTDPFTGIFSVAIQNAIQELNAKGVDLYFACTGNYIKDIVKSSVEQREVLYNAIKTSVLEQLEQLGNGSFTAEDLKPVFAELHEDLSVRQTR